MQGDDPTHGMADEGVRGFGITLQQQAHRTGEIFGAVVFRQLFGVVKTGQLDGQYMVLACQQADLRRPVLPCRAIQAMDQHHRPGGLRVIFIRANRLCITKGKAMALTGRVVLFGQQHRRAIQQADE